MHATALAANAYAQTVTSVGTPRSVEHAAFQRVTAMLHAAREPSASFQDLTNALYQNTRLWGILASDLASVENALPDKLRGQLFSLAEFSRRLSLEGMGGSDVLGDLIDVNTAVMRGLRGVATDDDMTPDAAGDGAAATG